MIGVIGLRKRIAALLIVLSSLLFVLPGASSALAAPQAKPWAKWQAYDALAGAPVDHAPWSRILAAYRTMGADGVARFRYGAMSPGDVAALGAYIERLAGMRVSGLNRPEQLAYWLNLYNALTVKLVRDHYPLASIRDIDISPGWFAIGPWDAALVKIEGEPLSLNDIEHRILRPLWQDPRVHYGLNCASIGCPNLPAAAFTGATVDAMLDQGARDFVNHPRGARIVDGRLEVSSIYVWFAPDFGGTDIATIEHLRRYAEPPLQAALQEMTRISGDDYDWSLNDAR